MGTERLIAIQLEAFPEQGEQTSIHGDGGGGVGNVLANTTLALLAAVSPRFPANPR